MLYQDDYIPSCLLKAAIEIANVQVNDRNRASSLTVERTCGEKIHERKHSLSFPTIVSQTENENNMTYLFLPLPEYNITTGKQRSDSLRQKIKEKDNEFSLRLTTFKKHLSDLNNSISLSSSNISTHQKNLVIEKKVLPRLSLPLFKPIVYEETKEGAQEIDYRVEEEGGSCASL